jgi:hypothetical protein
VKRLLMGAGALVMAGGLFAAPGALAADAPPVDIPGVGSVRASGDPASQSGYVYADGTNGGAGPDGYIGVNSSEGVVGCWNGDYSTGGGNNVITAIPPAAPSGPPATGGPCTPAP